MEECRRRVERELSKSESGQARVQEADDRMTKAIVEFEQPVADQQAQTGMDDGRDTTAATAGGGSSSIDMTRRPGHPGR